MPESRDLFNQFRVVLDRESALFTGGERVTGKVVVTLKQKMTLRAVRLHLIGKAVCHIDTATKDTPGTRIYCNKDIVLLERPPGKSSPGHFLWHAEHEYELPFECPLPRGCPTSYEGAQGYVRYTCRALIVESIDGTERERGYFTKRMLTVHAPAPMGVSEALLGSVVLEEQVQSGNCCCRERMSVTVHLPKSLHVAGEMVRGSIRVHKDKNKQKAHPVPDMTVRLVDRLQHNELPEVKTREPRVLLSKRIEAAAAAEDNAPLLHLPSVAPSVLRSSVLPSSDTSETIVSASGQILTNYATLTKHPNPLFSVVYELQVLLGDKLVCTVPLTLGNIPLTIGDTGNTPLKVIQPFSLGSQSVAEPEEKSWQVVDGAELSYAPMYAMLQPSSSRGLNVIHEARLSAENTDL